MDAIQDKDLPELLNSNIYTQREHLNLMTVQNLYIVGEWTKLCSKVCSRDLQSEPMSVEERECYRTCGINLSSSYMSTLSKFAKENGYKRY
jgi:hypothetical protein